MMKCGHAATGRRATDNAPVCVSCVGITPNAEIQVTGMDLTGRMAYCVYDKLHDKPMRGCTAEGPRPSSTQLPFFEYRPDRKTDCYYCGCRGWD